MATLNFNAAAVEPDTGTFDPVPAGWYAVMVDSTEIKPTKNEGGAYLQARLNILDGQYAGRKLFTRFNIQNANPVAQEIGYKQLSALAKAVGVAFVQESEQLHGIPLKVKVKVKPADGTYDAANEITAYRHVNDPEAGVVAGAPAAPAFAPAAGAAPAPWAGQAAPVPTPAAPPQAAQAPAWQPPAAQQPWAAPAAQAPAPAPQAAPPAFAPPPAAAAPAAAPAPAAPGAVPPWAQQPSQ